MVFCCVPGCKSTCRGIHPTSLNFHQIPNQEKEKDTSLGVAGATLVIYLWNFTSVFREQEPIRGGRQSTGWCSGCERKRQWDSLICGSGLWGKNKM